PVPAIGADDLDPRRSTGQRDGFRLRAGILRETKLIAVRLKQPHIVITGEVAQRDREVRGLIGGETVIVIVGGVPDRGVQSGWKLDDRGRGDGAVRFKWIGTWQRYDEGGRRRPIVCEAGTVRSHPVIVRGAYGEPVQFL